MNKMKVDHKAIAAGMYDMFTDEEKDCLAFGMLPAVKMEILTKHLSAKWDEINPDPLEVLAEDLKNLDTSALIQMIKDAEPERLKERKDWVRETEHEICLALYRVAPMVV